MADLAPLIRLRKHSVDQKQKFLSSLYRQAEGLERQKVELRARMAQEREIVEQQEILEAFAYFGRFAEGVKKKIDKLDKDIAQLEQRIEIARADLREAFADLKKIEITNERREENERKRQNMKESRDLDEIGIELHRRQKQQDE